MTHKNISFRFAEEAKNADNENTSTSVDRRRLQSHAFLSKKGVASVYPITVKDTLFSTVIYENDDKKTGGIIEIPIDFTAELKILPTSDIEDTYTIYARGREDGENKNFLYVGNDLCIEMTNFHLNYQSSDDYVKDVVSTWLRNYANSLSMTAKNQSIDEVTRNITKEIHSRIRNEIIPEINSLSFVPTHISDNRIKGIFLQRSLTPFFVIGDKKAVHHYEGIGRLQAITGCNRKESSWSIALRSFPIELFATAKQFRENLLGNIHPSKIVTSDDSFFVYEGSEAIKSRRVRVIKDLVKLKDVREAELNFLRDTMGEMVCSMMSYHKYGQIIFSDNVLDACKLLVDPRELDADYKSWQREWNLMVGELEAALNDDHESFKQFIRDSKWTVPVSPIKFALKKADMLLGKNIKNDLDDVKNVDKRPSM